MKKNQYIISSEKLPTLPDGFSLHSFGNYNVYKDSALELYQSQNEKAEVMILGFIINPFQPKQTNLEIVENLCKNKTANQLFEELESLSGRYLILYKNETDFVLFHDMFGQRQANYTFSNSKLVISSSVKLLIDYTKGKVIYIPNHELLMADKGFKLFDQWFLGDLTWDQNIKKLLPNFYLDLNSEVVKRIPLFEIINVSKKEIIEYSNQVVKGNYQAIQFRYDKIFQALTAGYDSRTLLAQSKEVWEDVQFYTFQRGDVNSKKDAEIAKKLSNQFKFSYKTIPKLAKNQGFEAFYKSQFIIPRTTPKFYNVLYFRQFEKFKTINISGDGVQMVRNLRNVNQLETPEILFDSLGFSHHSYHLENFREWLNDAKEFAVENGVLISDLFTQEIAQAQLTARWSHEFDLSGCEEFNPFNHKKMIYSILKNIPVSERIGPNYQFQKELMESSIQNITKIPFNPPTWKDRVKKLIGKKV